MTSPSAVLPFDMPPFRPRPPWWGADLQTLRNTLAPRPVDLSPWPGQHLRFVAANERDALSGWLHRPAPPAGAGPPLVIVIHGLTGDADGQMQCASAAYLLAAGYPVLRLNLRGAGDCAPASATLYHSNLAADIEAVLAQLPAVITGQGVVLFGYSLGGNLTLNTLRQPRPSPLLRGGISVCAPILPAAAARALERPRNRLYQRHLVAGLKRAALACALDPALEASARAIRSIRDYDGKVAAAMHGFASADDLYAHTASAPHLRHIRLPTLVVHAADDPWVPVAGYRAVDWGANPALLPVITPGGGHCGFHAADDPVPWHDRLVLRFLQSMV